jgi:cytochrome c oxidase subunit 3
MAHAQHAAGSYYLPEPSGWPIIGSIGLFITAIGAGSWLNDMAFGKYLVLLGLLIMLYVIAGWFGTVIRENEHGMYNEQVDRSFRWGMMWFIFSEVMFFGAFFGALFYARLWSVPWLGGEGAKFSTHEFLWPHFQAIWPLIQVPYPENFATPKHAMGAWGLPALNTLILLSSSVTVTWAHWGLKMNRRWQLILGLAVTVVLGALFLFFQAEEYAHAYSELNLRLDSGIYGTTFFMLTGFHGLHVTIGTLVLAVILGRSIAGHFSAHDHFGFEAAAWYWHFVDVVWLGLFIFVYWL